MGLALAHPIHGVLADRYGRRPVLLWGFGLFTLASLVLFFALIDTKNVLIASTNAVI